MSVKIFRKMSIVFLLLFMVAIPIYAAEINIQRARVLEVIKEEKRELLGEIGKELDVLNQTLSVEIVDGVEEGKQGTLENDYIRLEKGDVFFIEKTSLSDEPDSYVVRERDRQFPIYILLLIFAAAIVIFGGKQGLRSIASLVGGFLVIIYLLLPLLIKGYSPIFVSVGFAAVILFIAIYFTHGFNRESSVAFGGTIIAVILTGLLAYFSVWVMQLTGFDT